MVTGAAETGLHFVGNAQSAVLAGDLVRLGQIIPRAVGCATDALDRLRDERGDLTRRRVADDLANVFGALGGDLFGSTAERAAIRIRAYHVVNSEGARNGILPRVMRGQAHRARTAAVITVAQRDHVGVAGVEARHGDGEIVGLAAIVDEVGHVEALGHLRREFLRQQRYVRVKVYRRRVLERFHLFLDGSHDFRVAMPARNRHDTGEHVEVALPSLVEQPLHVAFDDQQRLAVQREDRGIGKLSAHRQDLAARRTAVGFGNVLGRRHLERGTRQAPAVFTAGATRLRNGRDRHGLDPHRRFRLRRRVALHRLVA